MSASNLLLENVAQLEKDVQGIREIYFEACNKLDSLRDELAHEIAEENGLSIIEWENDDPNGYYDTEKTQYFWAVVEKRKDTEVKGWWFNWAETIPILLLTIGDETLTLETWYSSSALEAVQHHLAERKLFV